MRGSALGYIERGTASAMENALTREKIIHARRQFRI